MENTETFDYFVDQFDDIRVLRYRLPGFAALSLNQKKFIYLLSQAALSGRDILWSQNFKYNLQLRKTIEAIVHYYEGDRTTDEFKAFLIYSKKVFFANGIHHHYSNDKTNSGFYTKFFYHSDTCN